MTSGGAMLIAGAIAMLATAEPIPAQLALYQVDGAQVGDGFGVSVAEIGDLDHDGVLDFAVGAPYDDSAGTNAGRVAVCSGATGQLLLEIHGETHELLGRSVARAFDFDFDGQGDVLVGAPGAATNDGRAYVFALPSGAVLVGQPGLYDNEGFGWQVAGLGDISGDGKPDYGVATSQTLVFGTPYPGCFETYSGAGSYIPLPSSCGTTSHNAARDVNGDGLFDFLNSHGSIFGDPPDTVELRSGVTYAILDQMTDDDVHIGVRGFPARDFDGDGRPDYIFTYSDPDLGLVADVRHIPVSGPPELVTRIVVSNQEFSVGPLGTVCCADVSGDGTPDVLMGFPDANNPAPAGDGSILAFDGLAPHELLFRVDGEAQDNNFPSSIVALGDLDGDGREEFAAGSPHYASSSPPGVVRVYTWVRWLAAWTEYGLSMGAHLAGQGLPAPLSTVTLLVDSATPYRPSFLVVGLASQRQPFKDGLLAVTPDAVVGPFWTSPTGDLSLSGAIPASVPPGLSLYFQIWVQPPEVWYDWQYSNGLQATIQSG